jgi:excisionase family DNA binding protein
MTDQFQIPYDPANLQSPVLTLAQAAAYLQISRTQLSKAVAGQLEGTPSIQSARVGRRILIKKAWLDGWLDARAAEGQR